jgi:hypothetical protein
MKTRIQREVVLHPIQTAKHMEKWESADQVVLLFDGLTVDKLSPAVVAFINSSQIAKLAVHTPGINNNITWDQIPRAMFVSNNFLVTKRAGGRDLFTSEGPMLLKSRLEINTEFTSYTRRFHMIVKHLWWKRNSVVYDEASNRCHLVVDFDINKDTVTLLQMCPYLKQTYNKATVRPTLRDQANDTRRYDNVSVFLTQQHDTFESDQYTTWREHESSCYTILESLGRDTPIEVILAHFDLEDDPNDRSQDEREEGKV